jgi:SAM-dependent methyltransferase
MKHPAKYTDAFIPIFARLLIEHNCHTVLDCMAGTGKIALVKNYGFEGKVFANDIEQDWVESDYPVDYWSQGDAAHMNLFKDGAFDAICTSPTYGNRLSEVYKAREGSDHITYTLRIGRPLSLENTGGMQWGTKYRIKHVEIYIECKRVLRPGGLMLINISNHIRRGKEIDVVNWTRNCLHAQGLRQIEDIEIEIPRLRHGCSANLRVLKEHILVLEK